MKIWCCVLTLLCLYLWPRRLPMFFSFVLACKNLILSLEVNGLVPHTEFEIVGESLMACGWKLNGLRCPPGGGAINPSLPKDGVLKPVDGGIGEAIAPKRPGNTSVTGDNALESKVIVERTVWLVPSIPSASSGSSGIGVGGVGVRGGAGIGRLDAIADIFWPQEGI